MYATDLMTRPILQMSHGGPFASGVIFQIKRTMALKTLMDVCAQRHGSTVDNYRFIFDGNRILDIATPDDLEMEDDDEISAMAYC